MRIVILGPPGAGKGTQAKRVSKKYGVPHIATGDIFREIIASSSEIGKKVEKYVKSGELVPDEIVNKIVRERLSRPDCRDGFILDGYPRTVEQAKALDRALENAGEKLDLVIELEVSDDEIVRRLSNRRVCRNCGAIYHLINNPPKIPGKCDKCQGELYQREDDREDIIRNRLRVYRERTKPLIDYYLKRGILVKVNGNPKVNEVWEQIRKILDEQIALKSSRSDKLMDG